MSLFQRAHDVLAAKANKALDAAEKPDEMLDLSYEQMLDQLTKVRQALVSVAASRKQLELQEQQLQHSVDHLQDQAKQALAIGREDLAREALSRKAAAQAQIDPMEAQRQQLTAQPQRRARVAALKGHVAGGGVARRKPGPGGGGEPGRPWRRYSSGSTRSGRKKRR